MVIFSAVLFWKESPLQKANRFLAITFMLLAGWNFSKLYLYYALSSESDFLLSFYFPVDSVFAMCIGPAIYLYVCILFGGNTFNWKKHIRYQALPLLCAVLYLIYFAINSPNNRIAILHDEHYTNNWMIVGLNFLFYAQSVFYFESCLLKVYNFRTSGYILLTNKQQTNIRWLVYLFCFGLIAIYLNISVCTLASSIQMRAFAEMSIIDSLIIYILIQSVWRTGLSMQEISTPLLVTERALMLNSEQTKVYFEKLCDKLETSKIYLTPNCTLEIVAKLTDMSLHQLSNLINSNSENNFSDLINKYRIEYACMLICDKQKRYLTLEAIGFECGFGSRSNFNRAFKKHTYKTPTCFQSEQSKAVKPC